MPGWAKGNERRGIATGRPGMTAQAGDKPPVDALHRLAASGDGGRIEAVDLDGQRYWIKRREQLSLRWRLQKGNPARRFERERETLRQMAAAGAPVPPILAEGQNYFVLPDCGESLEALLDRRGSAEGFASCRAAFAAAGHALAALHARGLAHGRPHPRDLAWDGRRITFLDFERGSPGPASQRRQLLDLVQMVFACHSMLLREDALIDTLCAAYRESDRRAIWPAAQAWARRWRWLDPLTRPIQRYEARHKAHKRYQEWQAIPLALARLAGGG